MNDDNRAETYHGYSVDAEDQPTAGGDSTADDRGLPDPLDEGYSPPEKWSPAEGYGNTAFEESQGESLDARLAQEEPDLDPSAEFGESVGGEVGAVRSGRLVATDADGDAETDLYAQDVGIDGAGASAEEAAVHVIEE